MRFDRDEANRPDTTIETLARLKPAFRKDGSITAGNAPGLNSDAAALIVAERGFAEKNGLQPWARLVAHGVAAVEPGLFGIGPVPAVKLALERAEWTHGDRQVRVFDGIQEVASHVRIYDSGQQIEEPAHIHALVQHKRAAGTHGADPCRITGGDLFRCPFTAPIRHPRDGIGLMAFTVTP